MSRLHATLVALLLSAAAAAGFVAAVHTVRLGQTVSSRRPATLPAHLIAARQARLARWSRTLAHALAKHPPALPKLPKLAPVATPAPAAVPVSSAAPVAAPPVRYVRPPAVVKVEHAPPPPTTTTSGWSDDGAGDDTGGDDGGDGGGD